MYKKKKYYCRRARRAPMTASGPPQDAAAGRLCRRARRPSFRSLPAKRSGKTGIKKNLKKKYRSPRARTPKYTHARRGALPSPHPRDRHLLYASLTLHYILLLLISIICTGRFVFLFYITRGFYFLNNTTLKAISVE